MKNFEVRQGGFYVNDKKCLVREITHIDSNGYAHWRSYQLRDGTPTRDSLACSAEHMARWTDREATPSEVARMRITEAHIEERMKYMGFVDKLLEILPDEQLFAEVRRRGRNVI